MFSDLAAQNAIPLALLSPSALPAWTSEQPKRLANWVEAAGFKAESGRLLLLPSDGGAIAGAILGLGSDEDALALATAAQNLPPADYCLTTAPKMHCGPLGALAWALGTYRFSRYKPSRSDQGPPRLVLGEGVDRNDVERIAAGVFLVRDLVNTPANDMGPGDLEAAALALATRHGAKATVTIGEALKDANFPMVHAVGRASASPPRLIDFRWGEEGAPKITLVGKGVCFDTGGLDIKPSSAMLTMKKDMGGAAHVLGLAAMIMDASLPVRLRVLIPAVENAISGESFRPGDVLTSRAGLTVEIGNTDAEGRLVLADALTEADSESPDLLIDIATLTGAARVATGFELPPFFTDDDSLAGELMRVSALEADPMWRLPLWRAYDSWVNGKIADLTNAPSSSTAGAITAALFLKRFVRQTASYVHFDIAAWTDHAKPGRPIGAEAHVIRALYRLVRERFGPKTA